MKILNVAVLAAAAVALSACNGLTTMLSSPATPDTPSLLGNLQGCDRHYEGAIGVGVTGSFRITCQAQPHATSPAADPAT